MERLTICRGIENRERERGNKGKSGADEGMLVMSGLLLPRTARGAMWELIWMTEDVRGMTKYNWSQAVWSFLVEAIKDTKEKIPVTPPTLRLGVLTLYSVFL